MLQDIAYSYVMSHLVIYTYHCHSTEMYVPQRHVPGHTYVRTVHILHTHAATRPVSCVHHMTYVSTLVYTSLAMTDCIMFRVQFMHDTTYSGQKQEQPTCSEHEHVGTRQEVMCI